MRFYFVLLLLIARLAAAGETSLRLERESDREAFLNWFAFLAEAQFYLPAAARPREITDCSSLVRYAYHEALRRHDSSWAASQNLPLIPALPSVEQYSYPRTPQGPRIFATGVGQYSQFADAKTLLRYNTFAISRDVWQARRGDLLFFRQSTANGAYHTMIVLGNSQIMRDHSVFVIYDTGPEGAQGGEIKRLTVSQLLQFADPRWRPIPANAGFLGVFRWDILQK